MSIKDVRPATLKKVVSYLEEELGLEIIGQCVEPSTGYAYAGMQNHDIRTILELREYLLKGGEFEEYGTV